jgi:hypothetical protein
MGLLNLSQLGDHVLEATGHLGIAGGGAELGQGRQVMSGTVPSEALAFPVRVPGRLRLEPGLGAKRREKPVDIVLQQVVAQHVLRMEERSFQEADIGGAEVFERTRWRSTRKGQTAKQHEKGKTKCAMGHDKRGFRKAKGW